MSRKSKTAAEVLDYKFDFAPLTNLRDGAESNYLEAGETLDTTFSVTAESGINLHDGVTPYDGYTRPAPVRADTNTTILYWVSGGTLGETYTLTCKAETSGERYVERSMTIKIVQSRAR